MKRIISITLALIMSLGCTMFVSAVRVGETVGHTTYTDIVAYINHFLIDSYNMNGNTVIVAEDLANYGFDVVWDGNARALYISRNLSKNKVTQISIPEETLSALVGKRAFPVLATDIKTYINGIQIQSYNIDGRTVIGFDDLAKFGKVNWDGNMRTLKLWIEDGLEMSSVMQKPKKLPPITMYDEHGRTIEVDQADIVAHKALGWYEEPVIPITEPTNDSILPFSFEKNSVDGIKVCWLAKNVSNKTINYYTIRVYFYNSVGDPAYDEITGKAYKDIKYVGPVEVNEELVIFSIVGYVPACSKVTLGEITLEYSDGTFDEFWYGWSTSTRR